MPDRWRKEFRLLTTDEKLAIVHSASKNGVRIKEAYLMAVKLELITPPPLKGLIDDRPV